MCRISVSRIARQLAFLASMICFCNPAVHAEGNSADRPPQADTQTETTERGVEQDSRMSARAQCDINAGFQQCCSAAHCGGVVYNRQDWHNCKGSGGHSWTAGRGVCDIGRL